MHAPAFKIPITTILNADKDPTPEGIRACPGVLGGVEWNGPAFDPTSQTLYVGSVDWCATFTSGAPEYIAGQLYMGTGFKPDPLERATGWLHAVNGNDGSVRWKKQMTHPMVARVTPTAGAIVLTGDIDGNFFAFDAANGKELFRYRSDGSIAGGVVTYSVRGRQYVAFTSGNVSRGTFDTKDSPKVVVMAVDAPETARYTVALPEANGRGLVSKQPPLVRREMVFAGFCAACHGAKGSRGSRRRRSGPSKSWPHSSGTRRGRCRSCIQLRWTTPKSLRWLCTSRGCCRTPPAGNERYQTRTAGGHEPAGHRRGRRAPAPCDRVRSTGTIRSVPAARRFSF